MRDGLVHLLSDEDQCRAESGDIECCNEWVMCGFVTLSMCAMTVSKKSSSKLSWHLQKNDCSKNSKKGRPYLK